MDPEELQAFRSLCLRGSGGSKVQRTRRNTTRQIEKGRIPLPFIISAYEARTTWTISLRRLDFSYSLVYSRCYSWLQVAFWLWRWHLWACVCTVPRDGVALLAQCQLGAET